MAKTKSTVIVAPRERFSSVVASLESLFGTIPDDVPVIVVEGCSPAPVRERLDALRRRRPFDWVALDHFVTPHEARNIGIARSQTEYVVLADNDMIYEPQWLACLEENCSRTGAAVVAPLLCIGPPNATTVHHAGGRLVVEPGSQQVRLSELHRGKDTPVANLTTEIAPESNDVAEFHCLLARREFLDESGPLDERLITREQIDLGLRAAIMGVSVTFERRAIVTYAAVTRFDPEDLPYHLFRWSHRLAVQSLAAFRKTWNVELDEHAILNLWIGRHRLRAIESAYPDERRELGQERFVKERAVPMMRELITGAFATRTGMEPPRVPPQPDRRSIERFFQSRLAARAQGQGRSPAPAPRTDRPAAARGSDWIEKPGTPQVRRSRERRMTVAGMATMPSRSDTFREALDSILPQVDRLFLFFDRFVTPISVQHPKIVTMRSQEFGDVRAAGKFLGLLMCHAPSIYFSVDDDVAYPADYVARMSDFIASRQSRVAVGVHAAVLKPDFQSYRADREVADRMAGVLKPLAADLLGTDSAAFDTSALTFDVRRWKHLNMVDLQFALECARAGIPRAIIPRDRRWLRSIARNQPDSIFVAMQGDDSTQTQLARDLARLVPSFPTPSFVEQMQDPRPALA